MSEEGDIMMMNLYFTLALILWVPLGYIILLKYLSWNEYIFWFFGALGLMYFIMALVLLSKMKCEEA